MCPLWARGLISLGARPTLAARSFFIRERMTLGFAVARGVSPCDG